MSGKYGIFDSVFGPAIACVDEQGALTFLNFAPEREEAWAVKHGYVRDDSAVTHVAKQLGEYGRGERTTFDLKLNAAGTPFQQAVWNALVEIPLGETTSYGALAKKLGRPDASRAVGAANGANPIMLVVPCHRVIGANGALTGFGGGLPLKARMLEFERRLSSTQAELF
jgi:methylated-DNA-[protein]-cysteine S-methyltransferase